MAAAVVVALIFRSTWPLWVVCFVGLLMLSLWRAVRLADSVRVFHDAVDQGWLQATCMLRTGRGRWGAKPAVLTIAAGSVTLSGLDHEVWSAADVGVGPEPGLLSGEALMLTTPSGDRRLSFVAGWDAAQQWSAIVDRQAAVAVRRALAVNRSG